ncbi:hypothetical protein [Pontibacillus salipaludis]|uniref:hypothetical protein n=1 Tax=Pontibacillus salipaludis TaxID=1697394 RepID=UPI0031E65821
MEEYLKERLSELYKGGRVKRVASSFPSLYRMIQKEAAKQSVSVGGYISSLGFEYIKTPAGSKDLFDYETAAILIQQYNVNRTELAKWLNVSNSLVTHNMNTAHSRNAYGRSWVADELAYDEEAVVVAMLNDRVFTKQTDLFTVAIRTNHKNACVIVVDDESIKVIFNFPRRIKGLFTSYKIDIFSEDDFLINDALTRVFVVGKPYAKINKAQYNQSRISKLLRKQYEAHGISKEEYLALHGYNGLISRSAFTDEEIRDRLQGYVTEDSKIMVASNKTTLRQYFRDIASKNGMSLEGLLKFYGYEKK